MASPLRPTHVFLTSTQIDHLRLKAARRSLSLSAIVRELVDRDIANQQRTEKRQKEQRR